MLPASHLLQKLLADGHCIRYQRHVNKQACTQEGGIRGPCWIEQTLQSAGSFCGSAEEKGLCSSLYVPDLKAQHQNVQRHLMLKLAALKCQVCDFCTAHEALTRANCGYAPVGLEGSMR